MSEMKTRLIIISVLLADASILRAQDCDPQGHLDIGVTVQNSQIVTGVFDFNGQAVVEPGTRVWGGQFQGNPLDPFFTDDPGYGALSGSGLPQGSALAFDVLDDLKYWSGAGTISFGPVPSGEQLRIRLGGQNRFVGTGTGFLAGYNLQFAGAGGTIHVHTSFFLHGSDGNAVPASQDGIEATPGIYLLTLRLRSSDTSIAASAPLYVVFGNGVDACLHCTVLNHVGAHLAHDRPPADLTFDRFVDFLDIARMHTCSTGANVPWIDPCCQDADLDGDGDIDMDDWGRFQRCYSGPVTPADPDCGQ